MMGEEQSVNEEPLNGKETKPAPFGSPEQARAAGLASGRARRQRQQLRECARALLDVMLGDGETIRMKLIRAQLKKAIEEGDLNSCRWLFDSSGETNAPAQEIEEAHEVRIIPKIRAFLDWQQASGSNMCFVYGTTPSGKTWAILQWLVESLRTGRITGQILVAGQTAPFLRNGAAYYLRQICAELPDIEVLDNGRIVKNSHGVITCQSFEDESRALSAQWSAVYLNEGNYISREVVDALRIRTAGIMVCDYNPSVNDWWGARLQQPTNELFTTFADNPFLTRAQLDAIEDIRTRGETAPAGSYENWYYNVYYLGKFSEMGGGVFTRVHRVQPGEYDAAEYIEVHGIDWGDVTDPNALVAVKMDVAGRRLWVNCLYYETATDDVTMAEMLNAHNVQRIVCETATGGQTRMLNLKRLGFKGRPLPCEKEQVAQGVFNICGYDIYCADDVSYNEFRGYKIDEGKFIGADHCIDAVRYVAHLILTNKIR